MKCPNCGVELGSTRNWNESCYNCKTVLIKDGQSQNKVKDNEKKS